ncbi:MAG: hypothetical protein A2Y62_14665 [Candidatus Fischerbacteria bacterium RBG_13_37_8]|uniref:DinB-like domain-containing protein n=1 Tax=Candidatus Fischerbacteria bacterium RBG_13_37_8 TaxID=1817863 RepID=A0A1F5VMS7_9BACT|nr:MAG: hypothetical protein A2Y62_14665 [Candidatus Fischerbacteria bacterium RBG_13_37_8]
MLYSMRLILECNTQLFLNVLNGVTDEIALKRVNQKSNSILFLAAHLLDARYFLANYTGNSIECPFKELFRKVNSAKDALLLPDLSKIIAEWNNISPLLINHLEHLPNEVLQKTSEMSFPINDKTIMGGIAFLVQHESYHIGQIAFLRKLHGLPAMSYGEK